MSPITKPQMIMYKAIIDKAQEKLDGVDYYIPDDDREVQAVQEDDEYAKKLHELLKNANELGDAINDAMNAWNNFF
jgi:hypothetical protein